MSKLRIRLRTVAALLVLFSVIVVLHVARRFGLEGPEAYDLDSLLRWASDPVTVLATTLRWLALALAYYLVVVVALVGFGSPGAPARSRIVPPGVATMVAVLLGIAATSASGSGPTSLFSGSAPAEESLTLAAADEPLTLEGVDDAASDAPVPDNPPPTHPLTGSLRSAPADPSAYAVAPGDHFWSIAEARLAQSWGRQDLTDREIAGYWRTLIDANADQLVEPDNPDLLLPGQVLRLPEPPRDARR